MGSNETEEDLWETIRDAVHTCVLDGTPSDKVLAQYLKVDRKYEVNCQIISFYNMPHINMTYC